MLLNPQLCNYGPSKYFQLSPKLFVRHIYQHQISHQQFLEMLIDTWKTAYRRSKRDANRHWRELCTGWNSHSWISKSDDSKSSKSSSSSLTKSWLWHFTTRPGLKWTNVAALWYRLLWAVKVENTLNLKESQTVTPMSL